MASVHRDGNGYRISWLDGSKKRKRIRINGLTKRQAEALANRIQQLVGCQISGQPIDSAMASWLYGLGSDLRKKLERVELIQPIDQSEFLEPVKVGIAEFIDDYIKSRKDAADNTVRNWINTRHKLTDYFSDDRDLRTITPGDADDWRQSLVNDGFSESTISKTVKHAKQFLKAAVRKGFADSNPFHDLKAGGERNDERKRFVERSIIDKVIAACPSAEWRLIVALCRFGGLRCPSEVLALTWDDIDWERNRFTVSRRKTKTRIVPLFPELRRFLEDAFANAEEGDVRIITSYREEHTNMRTQLLRIIKKASVQPWERLFHNLRASRQTELENEFPSHVVCEWMGNSESVARNHYLKVTDDHFTRAVSEVGQRVGQKMHESNGNDSQTCPTCAPPGIVFSENCCFSGENEGLQSTP